MGILYVLETHVHADHLSGCRDLGSVTGAVIGIHESAPVVFPAQLLADGDSLEMGNVHVKVIHTPGHSPDSVCFLVTDKSRGPEAWFVLTGDTLFVGDAGRPDLHGRETARKLAGELYDSLFHKLMRLPDDIEVYPSHFGGSACGRSLSGKPHSTIGFERRYNVALKPRSREEFISFMLSDLPAQPPEFETNRQKNLGLVPVPI
ncbi:MAG: MBL fold metallo-hydrolase [Armatimonadetes bacterium]|nr:MBL fold metallo-hydrolase [Armatimonadota bacterium]